MKYKREIRKKEFTGNLGRVEELDDRLICYVDGSRFINILGKRGVRLFGKNLDSKDASRKYYCSGIKPEDKELAQKMGLDKPIYYIFDGIKFDCYEVLIKGINNCNVIIKNCKFPFKMNVDVYGKCRIENPFVAFCETMNFSARELTFDSIDDSNISITIPRTYLEIFGNKVNIYNSIIGEHAQETCICSNELNITYSTIKGDILKCTTEKINVDKNVYFIPRKNIEIHVDKFDEININSPDITINGETHEGKRLFKAIDKNN